MPWRCEVTVLIHFGFSANGIRTMYVSFGKPQFSADDGQWSKTCFFLKPPHFLHVVIEWSLSSLSRFPERMRFRV